MQYFNKKSDTNQFSDWECSNPNVEKFWVWGGFGINPKTDAINFLSLLLKDGNKMDFQTNGFIDRYDTLLGQADNYLKEFYNHG